MSGDWPLSKLRTSVIRHNADRETLLPIYLGLMLQATAMKRELVAKLHKLGLAIIL